MIEDHCDLPSSLQELGSKTLECRCHLSNGNVHFCELILWSFLKLPLICECSIYPNPILKLLVDLVHQRACDNRTTAQQQNFGQWLEFIPMVGPEGLEPSTNGL